MKSKLILFYLSLISIFGLGCFGGPCGDDPIFDPSLLVTVNILNPSGNSIFKTDFPTEELETFRVYGALNRTLAIKEDGLFSIEENIGFLHVDSLFGHEYHLILSEQDIDTLSIFVSAEEESTKCPFKTITKTVIHYNGEEFYAQDSDVLNISVDCIKR